MASSDTSASAIAHRDRGAKMNRAATAVIPTFGASRPMHTASPAPNQRSRWIKRAARQIPASAKGTISPYATLSSVSGANARSTAPGDAGSSGASAYAAAAAASTSKIENSTEASFGGSTASAASGAIA